MYVRSSHGEHKCGKDAPDVRASVRGRHSTFPSINDCARTARHVRTSRVSLESGKALRSRIGRKPLDGNPRQDEDRLIEHREAARLFGVSADTLRRWHKAGLITARRTMGRQRRYWESEVRARATERDEAVAS